MAEVRIEKVEKVYQGGVRAVKGISLDIADGSFVVLVGPSGCGKSTTLRMIAGLEDISGGQISIGDRVVNKVAPKDRDIAMVFQNYALYPHMTVYQNMAFGLKLRKMSKSEIDQRVRDASAILGLDEYLSRKPKALSGGQRQRVAVGRAIVREPACFLFDEPLSNLDAKLRVGMRSELKSLHQRLKTTTIYVTHDQEEAMTLGDQVVVMADGIIQQSGSPEEVFRRPVNRFVAGFVGTPPTNFLAGALHGRDGKVIWRENGTNGVELELGPSIAEQVRVRAGDACVIGIRPGSVTVDPSEPEGRTIRSEVLVVEPLGEQTDLRTRTASGEAFTARVSSDGLPARAGETVSLAVQPERLMLFEPGEFGASMTTDAAQPLQTS